MWSCIDVRAHATHMYSKHVTLSPVIGRFPRLMFSFVQCRANGIDMTDRLRIKLPHRGTDSHHLSVCLLYLVCFHEDCGRTLQHFSKRVLLVVHLDVLPDRQINTRTAMISASSVFSSCFPQIDAKPTPASGSSSCYVS